MAASAFYRAFSIFRFWFSDSSSAGISGSSTERGLNFFKPLGLGPFKKTTFYSSYSVSEIDCTLGVSGVIDFGGSTSVTTLIG